MFSDPSANDFVVAYDEVRDTGENPQRRAFYLGANVRRLMEKKRPVFVNSNVLAGLAPVPLNGNSNGLPFATFTNALTIRTAQGEIGPYDLPTYEEKTGATVRWLLTPGAVATDAAFGAVIIGVTGGILYLYSGGSY